jgi:hypothetical protein
VVGIRVRVEKEGTPAEGRADHRDDFGFPPFDTLGTASRIDLHPPGGVTGTDWRHPMIRGASDGPLQPDRQGFLTRAARRSRLSTASGGAASLAAIGTLLRRYWVAEEGQGV